MPSMKEVTFARMGFCAFDCHPPNRSPHSLPVMGLVVADAGGEFVQVILIEDAGFLNEIAREDGNGDRNILKVLFTLPCSNHDLLQRSTQVLGLSWGRECCGKTQ